MLTAQLPATLCEVPLSKRMTRFDFVPGFPEMSAVRRWRNDLGIRRAPNRRPRREEMEAVPEDVVTKIMTELPVGADQEEFVGSTRGATPSRLQDRWDPMKLINAVAFSLKLKDVNEFSDAIQESNIYQADPDLTPPERDPTEDCSRPSIVRAKCKLDMVGMQLDRRRFHAEVAAGDLDAINVFTDGSPVVGQEIQGMVADFVKKDGSVRRVILPGATLAYGHFDSRNKTMCLLHALWLICGPDEYHLQVACGKVSSLTTDFGIEMSTSDMPDCVAAYMAFQEGATVDEVKTKVKHGKRLFPKALRIAGWNHSVASITKSVMKGIDLYPDYLNHMRALCTFSAAPRIGSTCNGYSKVDFLTWTNC